MASCKPEDHLTQSEMREIAKEVWHKKCETALIKEARKIKYDMIDDHHDVIEDALIDAIDQLDPKEVMDYFRSKL